MTPPSDSFDLVTVGNYTKDTIVTRAGTRHVHGGGFNYAAHAGVAAGLSVAAVTRLAREDAEAVGQLEAAGVRVFPRWTASSTLMRLEYPTDNVDERVLTVAATAGSFEVDQVRGLGARAFVVSPSLRGEVGAEVIAELRRPGVLLGLDVQGYVRIRLDDGSLRHTTWPEMPAVVSQVDVLKTDAVEAQALTGESDHWEAARRFAELGAREVLLTHREGLLVLAAGAFHEAPFRARTLAGRSGRGDTCLGSYVAFRLRADAAQAALWAAAATSLKLEREGPLRRGAAELAGAFVEFGGDPRALPSPA